MKFGFEIFIKLKFKFKKTNMGVKGRVLIHFLKNKNFDIKCRIFPTFFNIQFKFREILYGFLLQ